MSVRVARGTISHILNHRDSILLQVSQAKVPERAGEALEKALNSLYQDGNGPNFVSEVMLTPHGPTIFVDAPSLPNSLLRRIPEIVSAHLEAAGIDDAVIGPPPQGYRPTCLEYIPGAVALHLFQKPPARRGPSAGPEDATPPPPPEWVRTAVEWVGEGRADTDLLWAELGFASFPLALRDAGSLLARFGLVLAGNPPTPGPTERQMNRERWTHERILHNMVSRIGTDLRGAYYGTLVAGGPHASDDELLELFEQLKQIARRLASLYVYGFIHFSNFFSLRKPSVPGSVVMAARLVDQVAIGGFAYQVLGPGHIARLGSEPPGSEDLGGGMIGVAVDDPSSWLPDHATARQQDDGPYPMPSAIRDPGVTALARQLLSPCLVSEEEAKALHIARYGF